MTKLAIASVVFFAVAGTAAAQDKKPAPAPVAAPAAKPAAAAPAPAPAARPAIAPPAAGAMKPGAAPMAPAGPAMAPPPPPAPPEPSKELAAFMKPYEGTWKCETKFPANAFGPGSPELTGKTTVKFKKDLDGFFYRGEWEAKKQKGMPVGMKGIFFIGWDPGASNLVFTLVDNMGSAGMATGKIEGDATTYSGEAYMMGKKVKTRESMSHKDKEIAHTMEVDMGKGFMMLGQDTCKK
jgi:hypothetical protein